MSQLSVTMTGDEADLFAKLTTMISKVAESEAAFKKAGESSNAAAAASKAAAEQAEAVARATAQAAKEQDAFAAGGKRLADQLLRSNETLEESYNRQKTQLKAAYESGKVGAAEYEKSLSLLKSKHEEQQEAQQRAARQSSESYRLMNREAEEGVSIAERLKSGASTLETKYQQMAAAVTQAHNSGKISADQHRVAIDQLTKEYQEQLANQEKAIGGEFLQAGEAAVRKWASIAGAIAAANQLLEIQADHIERGTKSLESRKEGAKDLASVSNSLFETTELNMQAKELQTKYAITPDKSNSTVFALRSYGLISNQKTPAENFEMVNQFGLYGQVSDPEQLARIAGSLNKSTGLSAAQGANVAAAASEATKVKIDQLAKEMEIAMSGAIMFSQADREDLATQTAALTSLAAATQPNAGTLVKGAFMKLSRAGKDKSPLDALAAVAAMDDEAIREKFGESEPLQVMVQLYRDDQKGFESIAQLTEKVMAETGTEKDYLGNKVNFFDKANPNLVAMRNATREEQALNISAENSAGTAATNKAVYNRVIKNLNKSETIPDFAKPPLQVLMGGIAYMGDMWNFEIAGNKEASINRGREEWLRAQVDAARNGTPIPEGQIPGLSASEQARHNESLDVLKRILSAAERPAMQAPTRPGDDR